MSKMSELKMSSKVFNSVLDGSKIPPEQLTIEDHIHMIVYAVDEYRRGNKAIIEALANIVHQQAINKGVSF